MLNVNETVTSIKPCYKIRYLSLKVDTVIMFKMNFSILSVILSFPSYRELSIKFKYAY